MQSLALLWMAFRLIRRTALMHVSVASLSKANCIFGIGSSLFSRANMTR